MAAYAAHYSWSAANPNGGAEWEGSGRQLLSGHYDETGSVA
jgi:hypothetical protein